MKGGVLGIIVVCVILGMSILLVSILDVQEETKEVTKYNYVTDTTSLFDFDKTPQYMDYDMVLNYTGYYTRNSHPYWGGVGDRNDGYYTTTTINRYGLNLAPVSQSPLATYNLASLNLAQTSITNIYCYGSESESFADNGNFQTPYTGIGFASLQALLNAKGWADASKVEIRSLSDNRNDRILIISDEDITDGVSYYSLQQYIEYHKTWPTSLYPDNKVLVAPLSAQIISGGFVKLYSTPEPSDNSYLRTIDLGKAYIVYNKSAGDSNSLRYGSNARLSSLSYPPNEYLDISKGVRVTEEISTQYATVTFAMNPLIDVAPYPMSVPLATTISLSGNTIVFTYGSYTFAEMPCPTVPGYEVDSITGDSVVAEDMTITINYSETEPSASYTLSFVADNGTVSPTTLTVAPGTAITVSDNTMTIDGTTITATADTGYTFYSWTAFGSEIPATVESNMVITANFTPSSGISGTGTINDPYTMVNIDATSVYQYFNGNDKYVRAGTIFNITDYDDGDIDTWVNSVTSGHGLYVDTSDWALKGTLTGSGTVTMEVMENDGSTEGSATYTFYIVEG